MHDLIDQFTPGELLHIVSIANKHGLLRTEQKRFLIALRMASPYEDGVYKIEDGKKLKFYPLLSQFLTEFNGELVCEKEDCPHCKRFLSLHADFHGPQESREFAIFLKWVKESRRHYGAEIPREEESRNEEIGINKPSGDQRGRAALTSGPKIPALEAEFKEEPEEYPEPQPLFVLNPKNSFFAEMEAFLALDLSGVSFDDLGKRQKALLKTWVRFKQDFGAGLEKNQESFSEEPEGKLLRIG